MVSEYPDLKCFTWQDEKFITELKQKSGRMHVFGTISMLSVLHIKFVNYIDAF